MTHDEYVKGWKVAVFGTVVILLLGCLSVGGCTGVKAWQRTQKRADANNKVKVTHILIRNADQKARIVRAEIAATKAEAEKRFQESVGIRRAQDEISSTLSPIYVQHEAIRAQLEIARSGRNNTVVYVPSGTNGTPVITANASRGK